MEEKVTLIEGLYEKTSNYAKKGIELYKLKAINKSADVISTYTARFTVALVVVLFFLILNVGVALWLGEILGSAYYGFFSLAGFYALVSVVFYFFHNKWIKEPLRNFIIEETLK